MKYEKTDDPEQPHTFIFETYEEVEVVKAAFREVIHRRAEKGNSGSISRFDRRVIKDQEPDDEMTLKFRAIEKVTEILDDFHAATDDAIVEIPNKFSCSPPYADTQIYERFDLGERAQMLSDEIKKAAAAPPEDPSEDPEEMIEKFIADLNSGPEFPDNP